MRWLDPWRLAPAAAVLLAALLVLLGVLQHRWVVEVGEAERQRLRERMQASAERVSGEVSRELGRALLASHPDPHRRVEDQQARIVERLRAWRAASAFPDVVTDVLLATRQGADAVTLERLDPDAGAFAPAPWPDELASLRRRMARRPPERMPHLAVIDGPGLALVLAPGWSAPSGEHDRERGVAAVILRIDRERLATSLVPPIIASWFRASGDLLVAVVGPDGPLYLSDRSVAAARYLPGDVSVPLFSFASVPGAAALHPEAAAAGAGAAAAWRLAITHRAGSLDAVVARSRHRQLAVSGGVLVLLAGTLAVLGIAARRAHRLARQQLDFVAGVTHELNTPLAAIRSAAQNLADGVVGDPERVRRYGLLIESEGSRLSSLVTNALELAGIQAGTSRIYRVEPVSVADLVEEVLAARRFVLEEQGFEVTRELPEDLPPVLADRRSVHVAVQNLIDNAVEHAAEGRWIGVRAHAAPDGRTVTLVVDDRGPGVRPEDRPHVFEPFYRGRARPQAPGSGSGMGLGLVRRVIEAQGGRAAVRAGPGGRGASFEIELPAARDRDRGAP